LGTLAIAATLLTLVGCGKEESDESLAKIAVKTEKQNGKLDRVTKRIDGMEARLSEMEASLRKMSQAFTESGRDRGGEMKTVTLKDRAEFKQIAKAISAIKHRLDLVEGNSTMAIEGRGHEQAPPAEPEDPLAHLEVVDDPQEMHTRLEALLQAFYSQIDDPARREEFEADIQRLKQSVSEPDAGPKEPVGDSLVVESYGNLREEGTFLSVGLVWEAGGSIPAQLRVLVERYNIPLETLKDAGFAPVRVTEAKPGSVKKPQSKPKLAAARKKSL